ncbi:hypothetical protein QV08_03440 [Gallibacterium salpingitidis]|uniref:Dithiobiotin synthetase n=1 Tax=Gallibacterium salpingitidis TaxID=505341 RepID=A0A1A7P0B2_9PAST|nr:pimeloyl-ACP methyl esterase BioG family protein [Gallibacterium salpingitidis]OBW95270.1 hypothetical protein QS62_03885 [Gallibacterium salpingitidis]OBX08766.1 hypothetical protein QV08_03440 [Gallibacterium salpingitidis]WKT00437.1 DUF452 family protein [Gallibacterium salpingitidis]
MKLQYNKQGCTDLIVYFAGWGTPPSVVQHLDNVNKYDVLICYDYQDLALEFDFSPYQNIYLVAWSMGVWVAEQVMQNVQLTKAIAINGTSYPRHDQFGIPEAIFDGTLTGLDQSNRHKFERRMCQSRTLLAEYQSLADYREFDNIYQELSYLSQCICEIPPKKEFHWDIAWIGSQDRIFPVENQQAYWQTRCQIQMIAAGHYLFPYLQNWQDLWR